MRYQNPNCNYTSIRKPKEKKNEENSVVYSLDYFQISRKVFPLILGKLE